jgi:hypothetical protein
MTLDEAKKALLGLKPDYDSFRLTDTQLVEINIPGVEAFDTKAKANWLKAQFGCTYEEGKTTGEWVFRRSSKSN